MTQPLTRQERIFSKEQTALLRQSEQLLSFNLKQLKTQSMTCSRPHVAPAGPSRAGPVNPISWLGTKAVVDTDDSSIKPARTKVELLFFHLRQSKASWERKVASRRGARLCGHRSRGSRDRCFRQGSNPGLPPGRISRFASRETQPPHFDRGQDEATRFTSMTSSVFLYRFYWPAGAAGLRCSREAPFA